MNQTYLEDLGIWGNESLNRLNQTYLEDLGIWGTESLNQTNLGPGWYGFLGAPLGLLASTSTLLTE